uniref:Glycosyltransferase n=1 Tax=Vitis amurensis TaxID=103351 RepID=B6DU53_9ROSI|nr:UDP-glucose: flavonoid 3-O-glucosyltransferase [Vitis amurensis]
MSQTTTNPHVAVLAFPFSTHAAPLLAVVRRLAAAAPHAVFSFFSTSQSNASVFHDSMHTMQCNIKSYDVSDGVPEGYVFAGRPQEDIELFMRAAPEGFRQGMVMAVAETGRPVSCLVADAFIWFAADMAAEMGVAWLPFWTAGPNSLSTHVYTDEIREKIGVSGIQGREDELLNFIPGMYEVRFRDLQEGIVFGNLNSLFSRMLHRMGQVLPKATAVFINSFEELDDSLTNDLKSKLKTYLNIGPFNLITPPPVVPNTTGCLQWLKERKPTSVVYISFGTVTTPPPAELVALAEALEASRVPFIWSLRDKARVHLPEGFLEKTRGYGMVVPWAPQAEVLAHEAVGAFVTHCGWNSLWESVAGGVPLICRPFFGDQRLNGRMVEDVLEIGVRIEGGVFTKSGLMSCFDQILSQEKGKKLRENLRALRETADRAVGPKGSSTENFKTLVDLVSKPKDV